MTDRMPLLTCFGNPLLEEPKEFVVTWGLHLVAGVMPGLLLVTAFLLRPYDFLALGPTAVVLVALAFFFVVALPFHNYMQFLGLRTGEPWAGPFADWERSDQEPTCQWTFPAAPAAPPSAMRRKTPRVAALEEALLRRAGLRRPEGIVGCRRGAPRALDVGRLSAADRWRVGAAYADLDLPLGADLDVVRQSYRRLMHVYHPDRHEADPVARALAEELTRRLATSYSAIVAALRR